MALYATLSLVSKIDQMKEDIVLMEKTLATLLKLVSTMQTKQLGRRADLAKDKLENIDALLQSSHQVDNLLLKVLHLLNRCNAHSNFVQNILKLKTTHAREVYMKMSPYL